MMHPIISPYKKYYAVLKLDIFLFYNLKKKHFDKVKISNTSINRRNIDSSFRIVNLIDIEDNLFEFLEWKIFNDNTHYTDYKKRLYKSAEILIPKRVAPQYILEICPKCSEPDLIKKYNFSDEILNKINYNHQEFEFKKAKLPLLNFDLNDEEDGFFDLNGFFSRSDDE